MQPTLNQRTKVLFWMPFLVVVWHLLLCVVAFRNFRMDPLETVFCDYGDGLKNLFTLLQWVKEPLSPQGFFHFSSFQYPYGDAIWFTDCTPLFAIPFKWWCLHIWDVSNYTIPLYHLFLILNFPLCGWVLYKLLSKLEMPMLLVGSLSLVLPWINPMVLRLPRGHFNLSFSVLIAALFYLLFKWVQRSTAGKPLWSTGTSLLLLLITGFCIHAYYLPLLGMGAGLALLTYGFTLSKRAQKIKSFAGALLVPGVAFLLCLLLVRLTDPYHSLRHHTGMGYDWMEQKLRFTGLFSSYTFIRWPFPARGMFNYDEPEHAGYLGTALLLSTTVFAISSICSRAFRQKFCQTQKQFWATPFYRALAVLGFFTLMVSFGEQYITDEGRGLQLTNVLNPFYYAHGFTTQVEHFRALARFAWPFWFAAALWWAYTFSALWQRGAFGKGGQWFLLAGTGFFLFADTKSFVDWLQNSTSANNYFSPAQLAKAPPLPARGNSYCAILPLPYYQVGSEVTITTADDIESWSRTNYQWSVKTGLPLVASKMSRTPPVLAQRMSGFLAGDTLTRRLAHAFREKPLLIAANRQLLADTNSWLVNKERNGPMPWETYLRIHAFPQRHGLKPFGYAGEIDYYRWQLTFPFSH